MTCTRRPVARSAQRNTPTAPAMCLGICWYGIHLASAVTSKFVSVQWSKKMFINSACGNLPNVLALIVKELPNHMAKCLTWPQVAAILRFKLSSMLDWTRRNLKQQSSSPWPFMPEFRLLCYLRHSQKLSLSLPCNWVLRLCTLAEKSKLLHCYMFPFLSHTRCSAWCFWSNQKWTVHSLV